MLCQWWSQSEDLVLKNNRVGWLSQMERLCYILGMMMMMIRTDSGWVLASSDWTNLAAEPGLLLLVRLVRLARLVDHWYQLNSDQPHHHTVIITQIFSDSFILTVIISRTREIHRRHHHHQSSGRYSLSQPPLLPCCLRS